MAEKPMLFSDPMVRALLGGTKTQTRRVVKPKEGRIVGPAGPGIAFDQCGTHLTTVICPYGQPGDRLWVRETFARIDGQTRPWIETDYRATYKHGDRMGDTLGIKKRWTPSIHMPRHASRITLEVTGVRIELLQDISEADAAAEGIERLPPPRTGSVGGPNRFTLKGMGSGACAGHVSWNAPTATELYQRLWEDINGPGSWAANPWVWVVEFKRLTS